MIYKRDFNLCTPQWGAEFLLSQRRVRAKNGTVKPTNKCKLIPKMRSEYFNIQILINKNTSESPFLYGLYVTIIKK